LKLVFFNNHTLGVVKGDKVVDISKVVPVSEHDHPQGLLNRVITSFEEYRNPIQRLVDSVEGVDISTMTFDSPTPRPHNIVCMAVNYMEDGTRDAPAPINAFHKSPNAVLSDAGVIVLPDVPATIFEPEAEMALVIGKKARNVKAESAYDYIFGYMNFIDMSARGLSEGGGVFYQMKSRDTFAPMGPYLVTADEIADPLKLQVQLSVNGNLKQNFNTDDMAHKIPTIIEWVTSIHTLEPGDVVATGTNHRGLTPIMDGDNIELETQGLGLLRIGVRDDLKRVWKRETRLERQEQGFDSPTPQVGGKYSG
jgi:2-keto-4-pentenoate hydratase/2-oxohepta-3-ene-1,7-dioic acid hydratase in catechol pathway